MPRTALKVKNLFENNNLHKYIFILIITIPALLYIFLKKDVLAPKIYPQFFGNYIYQAQNDIYKVEFGEKETEKPKVRLTREEGSVEFNIQTNQDTKILRKGESITFNNVDDSVDIRYVPQSNGVKEEIILKKRMDLNRFIFNFKLDNLDFKLNPNKEYEPILVTKNGKYVFHLEKPYAYDSKGNKTYNVTFNIQKDKDNYFGILEVDRKWLTDNKRSFPVYIDPTLVHDTSSEFSTGIFNRAKDTGSGSNPKIQTYYQNNYADEFTVAYWKFDETTNNYCSGGVNDICDSSQNGIDLNVSGTTINTSSQFLGSASRIFNGTSDYASVNDNDKLDPKELTIEAWIKPSSLQFGNFVNKGDNSGYRFRVNSNGAIQFLDRGATNTLTSKSTINVNEWVYVAATADSYGIKIYINGELDNYNNVAYGSPNTSSAFVIGNFNGSSEFFAGDIDELRISNVARSPEEIKANAQLRPYSVYTSDILDLTQNVTTWNPLTWTELGVKLDEIETYSGLNLVSQWKLNDSSGSTATNNAGSCGATCNGTLTNFSNTSGTDVNYLSGWTANMKKGGSSALMFDGTDDYVNFGVNKLSPQLSGASVISMGTWFKANKHPAASSSNYLLHSFIAENSSGFYLSLYNNGYIQVGGKSVSTDSNQTANYLLVDRDGWHHIVGILDFPNDQIQIYLDGKLVQTANVTFTNTTYTPSTPTTYRDSLGSYNTSAFFNGILDSTFIYSRKITEAEILAMYSAGNIQIQTRVGSDSTPNDGSWEDWKPNSTETTVYSFDNQISKDLVLSLPMGAATVLEDYSPNMTKLTANGTGGLTNVPGILNSAADFESTEGDFAEAPDSPVLSTGDIDYTISVWVNMESKSDHMIIVSKEESASVAEYRLSYNLTIDRFRFVIFDNSGNVVGGVNAETLGSPSISTWYNIVLWHDSVNNRVCIKVNNGTEDCSTTTGAPSDTTALFRIGARLTTEAQFFDGIIDEVNMWKRILTSDEITTLYSSGSPEYSGYGLNQRYSPLFGGIYATEETVIATENSKSTIITTNNSKRSPYTIGLWQMDETGGSGAWIKDESGGGNHGTPSNCYSAKGISKQACKFNGSNTSISISNESNFDFERTQAFSIEAWVKTTHTSEQKIFSKLDSNSPFSGYELYLDSSGYLSFYLINNFGTGNAINTHSTSTKVNDGKWHHVAVTYSGSSTAAGVTLYVDGLAQTKSVLTDALTGTILNNITPRIGSRNGSAFFWNGYIDQVRVTGKAIVAIEVREAFRASKDQYYDFNLSSPLDLSSKDYLSFDVAGDTIGSYAQLTIGEDQYTNYQPDSNTVGFWHFDDLDIATANVRDISGYNNNGTVNGTTVSTGYIGQGKYFDGIDDYIDTGATSSVPGSGNITIEAWIRTTDNGNSRVIVSKGTDSDWLFDLRKNTSNTASCKLYQSASSAEYLQVVGLSPINDGEWHYLACVVSGTTMTLYVDGMAQGIDNTPTGSRDTTTAGSLSIGRLNWTSGYSYFQGEIDEVRISNTARPASSILQSYFIKQRSYNITIDFAAYLSGSNTISNSSDLSFSISARDFGLNNYADRIYPGEKIIIYENYDGTIYKAQGTVTSTNPSTGDVTVSSWDSGSTFPSGGFTNRANVFKWQTEYWDISQLYDTWIDSVKLFSLRITDGLGGKTLYLDNLKTNTTYLTNPNGSTISSSIGYRYLQYRIINTTIDTRVSSSIADIEFDYINNLAPNTPSLLTPSTNSVSQNIPISFTFSASDSDSDYLRYKLMICKNPEMNISCTTYDQTSSQTGWSGQNTQSNTAYTSGSTATFTTASLEYGQTYYWKAYAIDPAGTNTWSATQTTPFNFTVNAPTVSVSTSPYSTFSARRISEIPSTTSGWSNITGNVDSPTIASTNGWLDSTNFIVGKKYLIILSGSHNTDSLSGRSGLRLVHGSTPFTQSESIDQTDNTTAAYKSPYLWLTIWTATENEDLEVQLYWNGVGTQSRAEDISLIALDVEDAISNNLLKYSERILFRDLPDGTSSTDNSISLSFTPSNNNDTWWIFAYNQTSLRTGTGAKFVQQLKINNQLSGYNLLSVNGNEITPVYSLATVTSLPNSKQDITLYANDLGVDQYTTAEGIFALNLSSYLDYTGTWYETGTSMSTPGSWVNQSTLRILNSVNNSDWLILGGGSISGDDSRVVGRLVENTTSITDDMGGWQKDINDYTPLLLTDYYSNLSSGIKTFKLDTQSTLSGNAYISYPWLVAFSLEKSINYTTMNNPTNNATSISLQPSLQMTAVDPDSDYIRYKVKICTNEAMTENCNTYDQTSSQTGWSGQNTQSNTAYLSGTQATFTFQTPLNQNQRYYWIANSIDPAGTNTFHANNPVPNSFTTTSAPTSPSQLFTEGSINPIGVTDLTPEFSSIYNDPEGDTASSYQIQVNTQADFSGTNMWDSGKQPITVNNGGRSSDISYAGTTLTYSGTKYYWRMKYWDANDIEGTWSATANFTMKSIDAPTKCRIVKSNDNSQINVYWTDISTLETGYIVEQKIDNGAWTIVSDTLSPNSTNITINVSNNHTYQYRVAAKYNSIIGEYCTTNIASLYNGNFRFEGLKLEGVQIW